MKIKRKDKIERFDLKPGRVIARKYEVIAPLGEGWEGEVYKIVERGTGVIRAAKLFYPHRNIRDKVAKQYARKLHKLRHCPVIIQYHTHEEINYRRQPITILISEYVEGERLCDFLGRQPGQRLLPFQAVHLLYSLVTGIEHIHLMREYHGDLHTENIMVNRYGLGFDLKVIDLYHWSAPKRQNIQEDIIDIVRVFYDVLGGSRHYAKQPDNVKYICCGLKRSLILKKFSSITKLKQYLESMEWE